VITTGRTWDPAIATHGRRASPSPIWCGGADVLAASQDQGLEGVVAKRLASTYRPGTRGRDW
jgi:bifunctional non-homologous end joining protein LigD